MRVYRVTSSAFVAQPLSGIGAASTGARWNSIGTPMGYTSTSRSLAMLEVLAHARWRHAPLDRVVVPIDIPDDAIVTLEALPRGWDRLPYQPAVQAAGDAWAAASTSLALQVPSVIVPFEFNILVNPKHTRFGEIAYHAGEPFVVDARLLK